MERHFESVELLLHLSDGTRQEIPLAVWQVEAVAQLLGLQVSTEVPAEYQLASREAVEERMALYWEAVRKLHRQNRD